jgi:hypothetical protein
VCLCVEMNGFVIVVAEDCKRAQATAEAEQSVAQVPHALRMVVNKVSGEQNQVRLTRVGLLQGVFQ